MSTENVEKRVTGRSKAAIAGVPVAFLAVWAAIYAVASILPAIPLVGGGTFGGQEFILGIAGLLFGPVAGAVAATIGALIASFIGPATAYFGLLTFYPHLVGALVAGLLMKNARNGRLIVLILFLAAVAAWPLLPWFSVIGAHVYAQGAYWPMYLTGLITLWFSPWAARQIRSLDPKRVPLGVAVIAWTAYMVNHVYISLGYSLLYPEGPEQWVFAFWSGIVPIQRLLLTLVTVAIGSAAIIGLHRAGIRFPAGTGTALDEAE